MKKKIVSKLLVVGLAIALVTGCGKTTSENTKVLEAVEETQMTDSKENADATQEETIVADTDESTDEGTEVSEEDITIKNILAKNDVTFLIANHDSITVEMEAVENDEVIDSYTADIVKKDDNLICTQEGTGKNPDGQYHYTKIADQKSGIVVQSWDNATDDSILLLAPGELNGYARELYDPGYSNYTYIEEEVTRQSGAVVIHGKVADNEEMTIQLYADENSLELMAIQMMMGNNNTLYRISYDNATKMEPVTVADPVKVSVIYGYGQGNEETVIYDVPRNKTVGLSYIMPKRMYLDESMSEEMYLTGATGDMTIYAPFEETN